VASEAKQTSETEISSGCIRSTLFQKATAIQFFLQTGNHNQLLTHLELTLPRIHLPTRRNWSLHSSFFLQMVHKENHPQRLPKCTQDTPEKGTHNTPGHRMGSSSLQSQKSTDIPLVRQLSPAVHQMGSLQEMDLELEKGALVKEAQE